MSAQRAPAGLLRDRVAVVTGAAQGLGEAIAAEYAREGATVALVDINGDQLARAAAGLGEEGLDVSQFAIDITNYAELQRVVDTVVASHGRLDILVNNAAICYPQPLLETGLDAWRAQLTVNLEAVFMGAKLVAPHMIRQRSGRLINMTSINAFVSSGRWPAYDASKGGIVALTKAIAVELGPYGILANAIAPGFMKTPMSVINGVDESETPEFKEWFVKRRVIPMARAGIPSDVAGLAVFLASDYCRYLTGQVLVVDGGMTSRTWFEEHSEEDHGR
jgi:3-oxoacyl-[acyl-carrier protein] reductase